MKWTTQKQNDKTRAVCGEFTIIHCAGGKFQLRKGKDMFGTFADLQTAKAKAEERMDEKPAKPSGKATGTKHNKILGYSACAVAKALGQAGVKYDEAVKILGKHGVAMSQASLRIQLGFGRNPKTWEKHSKPAPLTEKQIAELRS
ncbi:MAG: hypothetical protein V1746_04605 [bacterium]